MLLVREIASHGWLQQNLSYPSRAGSAHGFDALGADPDAKESLGKCQILRIGKT